MKTVAWLTSIAHPCYIKPSPSTERFAAPSTPGAILVSSLLQVWFGVPDHIAFGFNKHIAMSMNYLHTKKGGTLSCISSLDYDGIARNFIARYISFVLHLWYPWLLNLALVRCHIHGGCLGTNHKYSSCSRPQLSGDGSGRRNRCRYWNGSLQPSGSFRDLLCIAGSFYRVARSSSLPLQHVQSDYGGWHA